MKIQNLTQGSPEWQHFRLNYRGASEAAAMLGLSPNMKRTELLHIKHTGMPKEFSDFVQERILDHGHEVEALARPLVEEDLGEDLYPVTCTDDDGWLSASCDGLTMDWETAFEHKQWNEELAASVREGIVPDSHMPQCQQIMMVTGARRVRFTVSDGTRDRFVWIDIEPDQVWFDRIRAGWAQFDRDLADYVLPAPKAEIVANTVQALPAVSVQVSGSLAVVENFTVFEEALRKFLDERLIREPETDQDFADLDLQIKALKRAEDALDAAEAQMLAQVAGVDAAKRAKDALYKLTRDNRLMAEKLLESEKKRRREEKLEAARKAFADHLAELQREISGLRLDVLPPDFAAAIKGLKTLASVQDKIDTALANGKIAADQKAADLRAKLAWVATNAAAHRALLADLQQLAAKPLDDFKLAITARIEAHKAEEQAKEEATRERIRKEEAARLEREQREAQAAQEAANKRLAEEQAMRDRGEYPSFDEAMAASEAGVRLEYRRTPHEQWRKREAGHHMDAHFYYRRAPAGAPAPTPAPTAAPASVRTMPPAPRQVAPVTQLAPRHRQPRPSDEDIIAALVSHFEASEDEVIGWLCELDLSTLGHAA